MKRLISVPLDFFEGSTNPKNRILFDSVQEFCNREFGEPLDLHTNLKCWVAAELADTGYEIVGLTTMRLTPDVNTFHVTRGDDSEEARTRARQARDMLTGRLTTFTQDNWGTGKEVFVFIDPKVERFWRPYLRLIKAKPSDRHIVLS